ncbi:MAG: class I SAM-dependent methyltransferase [Candidatus Sumerlaeaceae bacterium]
MSDTQPIVLTTRDGYDLWSEFYDGDGNPLVLLEEPRVRELLSEIKGLKVLDVGCGTGRHTVQLASAGAYVTGVDFSHGMLERARRKPGAELAVFVEHDLAQALPFEEAYFDRVICCLVLDHMAELKAFFAELARVCRHDGFIVISVMHPAMMLKSVQARFHHPETGAEVRPQSVANQISDYVMAAVAVGLRIEHLSEHAVDSELAQQTPRAEKYIGWPMLLLMKLRR